VQSSGYLPEPKRRRRRRRRRVVQKGKGEKSK